jgi:hypothetical protein
MKIRFRYIIYIGYMLVLTCMSCAGIEKQFNEFQVAIKETKTAFLEKINSDDPESADDAPGSGGREQSDRTERNAAREYQNSCYKHTVRWQGESLSLIAKWYTGSFNNWKKLTEANPRINPNLIKPGHVILIPPALIKTREPLPQKVAAKFTPQYFAHIVKHDGEKIKDIAGWYTGDSANWKVLAKVNPNLNADRLVAGNEIFIPKNILKTRKPVPPAKLSSSTPKSDPRSPFVETERIPAGEEKIKLFGPKQFPGS